MNLTALVDDDLARGVFRVHRATMTSEEILAAERERIFSRVWLYLGHASELAEPGAYRRRTVGGRPLVFVRGSDECDPRAPQHLPAPRRDRLPPGRGRGEDLPVLLSRVDLRQPRAPRRAPRRGRVRAGLRSRRAIARSGGAPRELSRLSLRLLRQGRRAARRLPGRRARGLDLIADQSLDGSMRVVKGEQRYSIRANWKLLAENSVDGYHAVPVHKTLSRLPARDGRAAARHGAWWRGAPKRSATATP